MGKRWRFLQHDPDRIASLESRASISPILAQLLLGRGITNPADVRTFLDVKLTGLREPDLLPGIREAADRISCGDWCAATDRHLRRLRRRRHDGDRVALQLPASAGC